jgi:hypothetical protein
MLFDTMDDIAAFISGILINVVHEQLRRISDVNVRNEMHLLFERCYNCVFVFILIIVAMSGLCCWMHFGGEFIPEFVYDVFVYALAFVIYEKIHFRFMYQIERFHQTLISFMLRLPYEIYRTLFSL